MNPQEIMELRTADAQDLIASLTTLNPQGHYQFREKPLPSLPETSKNVPTYSWLTSPGSHYLGL